MKKLFILAAAATVGLSSLSAGAFMGKKRSHAKQDLTVETITERANNRLEAFPNLKLDSVTETDGVFTVRIVTQDNQLVEEKIIDPSQGRRGNMNNLPLDANRVKEILEGRLALKGNPNIKVGAVTQAGDMIRATIVTQNNSLVSEAMIDPQEPFEGLSKLIVGGEHNKKGRHASRHSKGMMMDGHHKRGMMDDDHDMDR